MSPGARRSRRGVATREQRVRYRMRREEMTCIRCWYVRNTQLEPSRSSYRNYHGQRRARQRQRLIRRQNEHGNIASSPARISVRPEHAAEDFVHTAQVVAEIEQRRQRSVVEIPADLRVGREQVQKTTATFPDGH